MNLYLVSPSNDGHSKTKNGFKFSQLTLHVIASLTPPDVEVRAVDEDIGEIDFSWPADLVGITCMTATARRTYELADRFRARGVKVVLGGIHPTVLPEEAIEHADAVVIGEAEGCWGTLVEDFRGNRMKRFYRSDYPDLARAPLPRRDLGIDRTIYGALGLETTRGCPYACEFCSVSDFYGHRVRHRPVAHVVEDIKRSGAKLFMITDDNVTGHPQYSRALFRALAPLGITWVGQSSVKLARDPELLTLCRRSGCAVLFFGLESVSVHGMRDLSKAYNSVKETEEAIRIIEGHGIGFHPSLVLGLDTDTPAIFDDTLEFLDRNRIPSATVNVLTPYPGTRLHQRLRAEGRLLSEDWYYYNHKSVVFRPKQMTPEQLQEGYRHVMRHFYGFPRVATHLAQAFGKRPATPKRILFMLLWNLAHRKHSKVIGREVECLRHPMIVPGPDAFGDVGAPPVCAPAPSVDPARRVS